MELIHPTHLLILPIYAGVMVDEAGARLDAIESRLQKSWT